MRRILVERARAKHRLKRGGARARELLRPRDRTNVPRPVGTLTSEGLRIAYSESTDVLEPCRRRLGQHPRWSGVQVPLGQEKDAVSPVDVSSRVRSNIFPSGSASTITARWSCCPWGLILARRVACRPPAGCEERRRGAPDPDADDCGGAGPVTFTVTATSELDSSVTGSAARMVDIVADSVSDFLTPPSGSPGAGFEITVIKSDERDRYVRPDAGGAGRAGGAPVNSPWRGTWN